jgi:F0F1-type ATP synthase assembly protein I
VRGVGGSTAGEVVKKDKKQNEREESAWVTVARYSEIGFMIPASLLVGYFLGLVADHFLHTHWIYLFGIVVGAIAGFVSMIRKALESSREADEEEKHKGGSGSDAG